MSERIKTAATKAKHTLRLAGAALICLLMVPVVLAAGILTIAAYLVLTMLPTIITVIIIVRLIN